MSLIKKNIPEKKIEWESVYYSVEEAVEELKRRRSDKVLRKKVEKFLKNNIPSPFMTGPKAAFGRDIMTPNREFFTFLNRAHKTNLDLFLSQYKNGKFVTQNEDKYFLGKLFFYNKKGKKGGDKLSAVKILDFDANNGKKLTDVRTYWGEPLEEFHRKLFLKTAPEHLVENIYDLSDWFDKMGGKADKYYPKYLSLFITHGILFETYFYEDNEQEAKFFKEVVFPGIQFLEKKFGVKPIIVSLCEKHEMEDFKGRWMHYPESLKKSTK